MKKQTKQSAKKVICPYCGSRAVLRSGHEIVEKKRVDEYLYVCKRYPVCDSYVSVQIGTTLPLGTLANRELRGLRIQAHQAIDQVIKRGILKRKDVYGWMSDVLNIPQRSAHIAMLDTYRCRQVIVETGKLLAWHKSLKKLQSQEKEDLHAT